MLRFRRLATLPLERFLQIQAASGILLLAVTAVAMSWANSPWGHTYEALWQTPVGLTIGDHAFERTLAWLVNDGLMVIFFFVVGMEIRRELHEGELSEWRRAALPAAAALGGMVVPAALYLMLARDPAIRSGWGVPMATDIAFAVGILTLLGSRVPAALRVLLLALAVIDDLGAILVIAVFYSHGFAPMGLGVAALGFGGVVLMQRLGVRARLAYIAPSVVAWAGIYACGVHPTIAGVMVGLLTPVRAWLGPEGFVERAQARIAHIAERIPAGLTAHDLAHELRDVEDAGREALSPAEGLIQALHPWVAFGIMPIFALANAGVVLGDVSFEGAASWAAVGAGVGLVVGKPVGVLVACEIALRTGLGALPAGLTRRHLVVLGTVAGVGFTMSLFVAQLAFADAALLGAAKVGVLMGSAVAATLGLVLGRLLLAPGGLGGVARTADEAEQSTAL